MSCVRYHLVAVAALGDRLAVSPINELGCLEFNSIYNVLEIQRKLFNASTYNGTTFRSRKSQVKL